MRPFLLYKSTGMLWPAGRSIIGLCSAWNHATCPSRLMTDEEHRAAARYARAVRARMERMGLRHGKHYRELSNGSLWPISNT